MKSNLFNKLAAEDFFFSDWISEKERAVVKEGWEDLYDLFLAKSEEITENPDSKLRRIITDSMAFIKHVGDPKYLNYLKGFMNLWLEAGFDTIANALKVRVEEAEYEEPDVEVPEEEPQSISDYVLLNDDWEDEEEAPPTQRSLVAKTLIYTNIFVKASIGLI